MEVNGIDLSELKKPFSLDSIHWRIGSTNKEKTSGIALAYLDARDVMERLDDVFGMEGWQCRYPHANSKTCCEIGAWLGEDHGWIWKANGAGDTNFEAEKGAFSDSFKRAAVLWGIGRYLYDMPSIWVDLAPGGRKIKNDQYVKLAKALERLTTHSSDSGSKAVHEWFRQAPTEMKGCPSMDKLQEWWVINTPFIKSLSDADKGILDQQKDMLKIQLEKAA